MSGPQHIRKPEKTIFLGALDATPHGDRSDYLKKECGSDPGLRSRVESLLTAHDRAATEDSFLEPPAIEIEEPAEAPGTRIGDYELVKKIGEGGFAIVYEAVQHVPVRRQVAIKVLKPGMDSAEVTARFESERQALALMDHPNIANVYDAGTTDRGLPFVVMELVKGPSLTTYCDEHRLGIKERLELFINVCRAVQHAHQKAIIHRDLKPNNILVAMPDGKPVPKVIDFGIAKAINQELTAKTLMTGQGQILGTPQYMSPEQVGPESHDVDTRTDVYALGVILYELLTGTTPIPLSELRNIGYSELERRICSMLPQRPSSRVKAQDLETIGTTAASRSSEATKLVRRIRGDLDWIVVRALENDRNRRYQTANQLALDIGRHLRHEPVEATPPSSAYRFSKFAERNKAAFAAGLGIAFALVAAVIVSASYAVNAHRARNQAEKSHEESETFADFLENTLYAPSTQDVGRTLTVAGMLHRAEERLNEDKDLDPRIRSRILATVGRSYTILGLRPQATVVLQQAVALNEVMENPDPTDVLFARGNLADAYRHAGSYQEAINEAEKNVAFSRREFGPRHPWTVSALEDLADYGRAGSRYHDSLRMIDEVIALRETNPPASSPEDLLRCIALRGQILWEFGDRDNAVAAMEAVLARMKSELGASHELTLGAMTRLANYYRDAERFDDALELIDRALPLHIEALGADHALTSQAQHARARILRARGDFGGAIILFRQVLASQRAALGSEHTQTVTTMRTLADALCNYGEHDEAAVIMEEVLSVSREHFGEHHPATLSAVNTQARLLAKTGPYDRARELFDTVLAYREEHLGEAHPDTLNTRNNLANLFKNMGEFEKAIELHEQVLETREATLGITAPPSLRTLASLASVRMQAKDYASAIDDYERILEVRNEHYPDNTDAIETISGHLARAYRAVGRHQDADVLVGKRAPVAK